MSQKSYIFGGRFQPFHIGHLAVVESIVQRNDGDLVIGIVNPDPNVIYPGDGEDWPRFSANKNPLSYWERHLLISSSLEETGFSKKVQAIVPLPRPSINLVRADNFLPSKPRVFVLCKRRIDEIEGWKADKHKEMGEEVTHVNIDDIHPIAQLASGDLIRSLIALDNSGWQGLIPPPAVRIMIEKNLTQKLKGNITRDEAKEIVNNFLKVEAYGDIIADLFGEFELGIGHSSYPRRDASSNETRLQSGLVSLSKLSGLNGLSIHTEHFHMDTYNTNQAAAVGPNSHAHGNQFTQIWGQNSGEVDLVKLADELSQLRNRLKEDAQKELGIEHDLAVSTAISSVGSAEKAARDEQGPKALEYLSKAGTIALEVAKQIGVDTAAHALGKAMGM